MLREVFLPFQTLGFGPLGEGVALGAVTAQAPSPGDLTLSNTHDVLTKASGPDSCQRKRGLTIAVCIILAMGNSTILPGFSLKGFSQQGLVVLFPLLQTTPVPWFWDSVYFGGISTSQVLFPACCAIDPGSQTHSLTPPGSEPNFTHQLIRKVLFLSTHWQKPALLLLSQQPYRCRYNLVLNVPFEADLLGHVVTLCLTFWGYAKLFFTVPRTFACRTGMYEASDISTLSPAPVTFCLFVYLSF